MVAFKIEQSMMAKHDGGKTDGGTEQSAMTSMMTKRRGVNAGTP